MNWDELRAERNRRLAETDYAGLTDTPQASGELIMYRQALRDLPDNTEDPNNVEWPVKPEVG